MTATRPPAPDTAASERSLAAAVATASAASAAIHLAAAWAHAQHRDLAGLLVLAALAQLLWAAVLPLRPGRPLIAAGVAVQAACVAAYVVTRLVAVPAVAGLESTQTIGAADLAAAVLAAAAAAGALVLAAPRWLLGDVTVPVTRRGAGAAAAVVLLVAAPAVVASARHAHDDQHHGPVHGEHAADHDSHDSHQPDHHLGRGDHDRHPAGGHGEHAAALGHDHQPDHDHDAAGDHADHPADDHEHQPGGHGHRDHPDPGHGDHDPGDHGPGHGDHGPGDHGPGHGPGGHGPGHGPGDHGPGHEPGHGHHPPTGGEPGYPAHWTPEQVAAADALRAATAASLARFATPAAAEAAGFLWIRDQVGGYRHYINYDWLDDGRILDPRYPESLIYRMTPSGPVVQAAMFILPEGSTMDSVPAEHTWLPGWHIHDNLCFNDDGTLAGLASGNGTCFQGTLWITPPMLHVWVAENGCGPFAGLDETGLHCDHHH